MWCTGIVAGSGRCVWRPAGAEDVTATVSTPCEANLLSVHGNRISPLYACRYEPKKNISVTLTLQNPTSDRVAFKVKTTSPKKYCVRPSNGFVEPNANKEVQVILQAQRDAPQNAAGGVGGSRW